jgi:phage shock protein A
MNILTRFWYVIKANANAVINKFEDPEKMLEQSIRDMQKQVERMRTDIVTVIAEEKKLKSELDKYRPEIEQWEHKAMLALKAGKEDLAKEALKRKQQSVDLVQQLHPQWEKQAQVSERLKKEYQQLKNRIEQAQHKKRNLVVRLRHAETQKRLNSMLTELKTDRTFERLEGKLADMEALTEAKMEVEDNSLENQFAKLTSTDDLSVEQELAALKERMKLNP